MSEKRNNAYKCIFERCVENNGSATLICPDFMTFDFLIESARMLQEERYVNLFLSQKNELSVRATSDGLKFYRSYVK